MSTTTVLAVVPDRRPAAITELRNSHGWGPSIWGRLLLHRGEPDSWMFADAAMDRLCGEIEQLPEWQQAPLVLTFDTGVIPWQAFTWAAEMLAEFDAKLPAPDGHVNHVPAVADVFRSAPEAPFIGVWGTSVSDNPFDPWDGAADAPGGGLPLSQLYLLGRHR